MGEGDCASSAELGCRAGYGLDRHTSKGCTAALICCLVAAVSRSAQALEPDYRLDYRADSGCPDEAEFARLVRTQLVEFRDGEAGEAGAHALVRLQLEGDGVLARLELERRAGGRYEREIRGESCDEVASALAFVLAYALGGAEGAPETKAEKAPVRRPSGLAEAGRNSSASAHPARAEPRESGRPRLAWRLGFGVGLGVRTGLGPTWTPVEAAVIDVRRAGSEPLVLGLRASVLRAEPITRLDRFGETDFSWLALRLDACPLEVKAFDRLTLQPCVGAHAGRITAAGQPTPAAGARGRSAQRTWYDVTVAARLELRVLRTLYLEAQGDLIAPLTAYRFAFDNPDTEVYQVPDAAVAGFLGLGAHFP